MAWSTAKEIVNDVAIEVGVIDADLDDPFASEDQAIRQMCRLLKKAGRDVVREREWSHLTRESTFTTIANQKEYDLPADFRAVIPRTAWDRSSRRKLGGPLSPQEWQIAKGWKAGYANIVYWRPANGKLWLLEDNLAADLTIAFEYRTNWWASDPSGTAPTKEAPVASLDVVFIDPHLITRALLLEWRGAKGFDTTKAQQDYDDAYSKAAAADGSGRPLTMGGPRPALPLISEANLPYPIPYT